MTSNAIPHYWDMHRCSMSWLLSWRGQNWWLITGIWWHTSIRFHLHSNIYHKNGKHLNYRMMMFSNPSWIPVLLWICFSLSQQKTSSYMSAYCRLLHETSSLWTQLLMNHSLHLPRWWLNMIGFSVCSLVLCCIPTWSWKTFAMFPLEHLVKMSAKVSNLSLCQIHFFLYLRIW